MLNTERNTKNKTKTKTEKPITKIRKLKIKK